MLLLPCLDGVFSFMDTYEEHSVGLKTSLYDIEQEMKELRTKTSEVSNPVVL